MMEGDVRAKDGVELSDHLRHLDQPGPPEGPGDHQAGAGGDRLRVELRQVDAAVFFDSSAGNDQNINHFYNDLQMYTDNPPPRSRSPT